MKRCKVLKYLPLAGFLVLAACSRDPKVQAQRELDNANKFYAKGKYREAALVYRRAIQKDLRFGEAYYRLALTELKLGNYGDALRGLRRSVELQPTNTDAITKLADLYLLASTQNKSETEQLLGEVKNLSDKLLQQNPNSYDGHRLKGQMALVSKNPAVAVVELAKANAAKPDQPDLVLVYFQALVLNNQIPEAEQVAHALIEKEKAYSPMYDFLYMVYARQNNVAKAEEVRKLKVQNNPTQSRYLVQLASHYYFAGKRPEMLATLQKLSDEKAFPEGHLLAGDFYFVQLKDGDSAREQFEAGMKAFPKDKLVYQKKLVELFAMTGKRELANDTLASILKDHPKDNDAIAMRAAMMLTTGNRDQINVAAGDLQSLVTKNPQNHLYHYNLARALIAKGDIEPGRLQLEEAIKLHFDFIAAREMLARVYMAKRDPAKALKEADEILRLDKNNLQAHLLRSSALLGLGEKDKVRLELDQISKVYPHNVEAKYQMGSLAFLDKDFKKAEQIFADLYKANPNDTRSFAAMTQSLAAQHRIPDAIKETQKAIDANPQRRDLKLVLAKFYVQVDRYDEAVAIFQTLLTQDPRSPELLFQMAEAERRKGDLNLAGDTFRRCAQADPADTVCLTQLGQILDALGKHDEAKPVYEQILKINPANGLALNNLAFIKAEEGVDLDQALTMSQRARQAMPNVPEVSDTLGWIYIKKNLSDDAVRVFKDLTAQVPERATFHYHYGMALLQKGDKPLAKKEFEIALTDHPSKDEETKIKDLLHKI